MSLPRFFGEMRVGSDVTLKFSQAGMAIASFSAVADKSKKNEAGEWEKDKEIWVRVTCFKKMAENVAESVQKGSLVFVSGQVSVSEWETKEGEKRSTVEVTADDIALSLRWDSAHSNKAERTSAPANDNPWTSSANDEPPF